MKNRVDDVGNILGKFLKSVNYGSYVTFLYLFSKERKIQRALNFIKDQEKVLRAVSIVWMHEGKLNVDMWKGAGYGTLMNIACASVLDGERRAGSKAKGAFIEFLNEKGKFEKELDKDTRSEGEIKQSVDSFLSKWVDTLCKAREEDCNDCDWLRISRV